MTGNKLMKRVAGFTIVEAVVSVGILAVLVTALVYGFRMIAYGVASVRQKQQATSAAQEEMENIKRMPYFSLMAGDGEFPVEYKDVQGIRYEIHKTVEKVERENDGDIVTYMGSADTGLKRVKVEVLFQTKRGPKKVTLTTLVTNPRHALTAKIRVTVRDAGTTALLNGARVKVLENTSWDCVTLADGVCDVHVPGRPTQGWRLAVSHGYYQTKLISPTVVNDFATANVTALLTPLPDATDTGNVSGVTKGAAGVSYPNQLVISRVGSQCPDAGSCQYYVELYNPSAAPVVFSNDLELYVENPGIGAEDCDCDGDRCKTYTCDTCNDYTCNKWSKPASWDCKEYLTVIWGNTTYECPRYQTESCVGPASCSYGDDGCTCDDFSMQCLSPCVDSDADEVADSCDATCPETQVWDSGTCTKQVSCTCGTANCAHDSWSDCSTYDGSDPLCVPNGGSIPCSGPGDDPPLDTRPRTPVFTPCAYDPVTCNEQGPGGAPCTDWGNPTSCAATSTVLNNCDYADCQAGRDCTPVNPGSNNCAPWDASADCSEESGPVSVACSFAEAHPSWPTATPEWPGFNISSTRLCVAGEANLSEILSGGPQATCAATNRVNPQWDGTTRHPCDNTDPDWGTGTPPDVITMTGPCSPATSGAVCDYDFAGPSLVAVKPGGFSVPAHKFLLFASGGMTGSTPDVIDADIVFNQDAPLFVAIKENGAGSYMDKVGLRGDCTPHTFTNDTYFETAAFPTGSGLCSIQSDNTGAPASGYRLFEVLRKTESGARNAGDGPAYDTDNNSADFVHLDRLSTASPDLPCGNSCTSRTPVDNGGLTGPLPQAIVWARQTSDPEVVAPSYGYGDDQVGNEGVYLTNVPDDGSSWDLLVTSRTNTGIRSAPATVLAAPSTGTVQNPQVGAEVPFAVTVSSERVSFVTGRAVMGGSGVPNLLVSVGSLQQLTNANGGFFFPLEAPLSGSNEYTVRINPGQANASFSHVDVPVTVTQADMGLLKQVGNHALTEGAFIDGWICYEAPANAADPGCARPAPDAAVVAYGAGDAAMASGGSDPDGRFRLDLPVRMDVTLKISFEKGESSVPGSISVAVANYEDRDATAKVLWVAPAAAASPYRFVLDKGFRPLYGKVTELHEGHVRPLRESVLIVASPNALGDDPPVLNAGAAVGSYFTTLSKPDGTFEVFVPTPGSYYIRAWKGSSMKKFGLGSGWTQVGTSGSVTQDGERWTMGIGSSMEMGFQW